MRELMHALGIDWKLLFAQILNFGILALVLTKFLYRPLFQTLDARRQKAEDIENAAKEAAEAQRQGEERRRQAEREARIQADSILKEAKASAETIYAETLKRAESDVAALRTRTRKELEAERQRVLREVQEELAGVALFAAEKVLERSVKSEDTERFVKEALSQMKDD